MGRENESQLVFKRGKTTLAAIFRVLFRAERLKVRTAIPATVVTYDPIKQRAKIRFDVLTKRNTTEGAVLDKIKVLDLPVRWPRTTFGFLAFPVAPEDKGHVIVCDRAIQQWLENGGTPDDPKLFRLHDWMDGIFEPGLHPNDKPISGITANDAVVLEGLLIKLGVGATEAAVLGTTFSGLYNSLRSAYNGHKHTYIPPLHPAAADLLTTSPTSTIINVPDTPEPAMGPTHLSTKVLIE